MSDEDLATVSRIYEGWQGGDFTVGVAAFADDVTLGVARRPPRPAATKDNLA